MSFAPARSALTRAVGAAALVATAFVLGAPTAAAEATATLSDVRSANGHVTGSLIIRGVDPKQIDTTQVIARIDGKSAEIKLSPATTSTRTTMLVIDTSGSMGEAGMATVRTAVKDFLGAIPQDVKVGVVSFSSTAGVDVAPTTDRAKVQSVVNGLRARGETSLYEAVQESVAALGTQGERSIVLLSDGEDTVAGAGDGGDAADRSARNAATTALSKAHVRAEVVAFKNDAGRAALNGFAKAGGGTVVSAADRDAVRVAFDNAAKTLEGQVRFDLTVPPGLSGEYEVVLDGSAAGQDFSSVQRINVTASAPEVDRTVEALPEGAVNGDAPSAQLTSLSGYFLPIALGTVLLGVFIVVLSLFGPAFRSRRSARVSEIEHYGLGAPPPGAHREEGNGALQEQLISMGDRVMSGRESTTKTMQRIERADLPWRAGEWFGIRVLSVVLGIIAFVLILGNKSVILAVLVGLVVGLLLPGIALRYLANRRSKKFESILPDVMMLVATSLSSGFSLLQALDSVARDAAEPAAKEFSRALAESRIGADISDALEHAAIRMESENMRWAVMAIRIQREVGGNLADTLRTTAATLRERETLKRHVRALSAEGRLSAYILIALPIGILLFSMYSNYDYVSLLWTTFLGLGMSIAGIISMGVGVVWMRKMVQIEV